MKTIDYDRLYDEFTLDELIGEFSKQETETIINNISTDGIDIAINLLGLREAFLRSLPQDLRSNYRQVKAREAYEFIFRAEVISRMQK